MTIHPKSDVQSFMSSYLARIGWLGWLGHAELHVAICSYTFNDRLLQAYPKELMLSERDGKTERGAGS